MKKNYFKNISAITIALVLMAISFTGCSKPVKTADDFIAVAKENNLTVTDSKDGSQGNTIDGAVRSVSAHCKGGSIYFWEFNSENDADAAYEKLLAPTRKADLTDKDAVPGNLLEGDNFKKFTVTSTEDFSLLSRVEKTLLMSTGDIDVKDQLYAISDAMGY